METVLTACRIGDFKLLKRLLAHQSPRKADSKGYTGLHWAIKRYYIECVETLLADGRLNVNAKTKDGSTALHLCLSSRLKKSKRLMLMKMLINKRADLNSQCNGDLTPLHIAAREGHLECLELLLQSGADITIKDFSGHTALETAKLWGKRECARRLAAFEWTSQRNRKAAETVDKRIRKEYADREEKESNETERIWGNNLSFQKWIVSKGFSLWENTTCPTYCQDRLDYRMSSPSPLCKACEPPKKPPDLHSLLRQSKPRPIEVSFRAKKQHFPTSCLLSAAQSLEKTRHKRRPQRKIVKAMKCGYKKEQSPNAMLLWPKEIRKEMDCYKAMALAHSRSAETLTDIKPDENDSMKTKSLTALEKAKKTSGEMTMEKETRRLGPPVLLSRQSHSFTHVHSKTCQAWGTRQTTKPNAFICVASQPASHSMSAAPQLVVEPRPLHTKRGDDGTTLDVTSHLMQLGENSQSISRYRGYKGSL